MTALFMAAALVVAAAVMPAAAQVAGVGPESGLRAEEADPGRDRRDDGLPARALPAPGGAGDFVPPEIVVRRLIRRGFYGFRDVVRRGDRYVVRAYGPRGNFVRVVADAATGEILAVRVLAFTGERRAPNLIYAPD